MLNRFLTRKRRWIICGGAAAVLAALVTGSVVAASAAAPVNTKEPSIAGSPIVGKDLAGDRGTWSGTGISYAYEWLRCDKNAANCAAITGATSDHYTIVSADLGSTIRFQVTGTNADGAKTVQSNPTGEITNGTGVPASSSPPTITVKDTRGYFVRNAYVFLRSTPILTSTPTDAQTATDGVIGYAVKPRSDFPLKNRSNEQFYVKAYRNGDPTLAGIAGTRLVQVATAK